MHAKPRRNGALRSKGKVFQRACFPPDDMNRKTHRRIAKSVLPNLPTKKINIINRRIDRPGGTTPVSPEFARLPGLDYRRHRKKGHDVLTAGIIGYQEAGPQGAMAGEIHIVTDLVSDLIRKKSRSGIRDLIEAGGNLAYELFKEHNDKKRKSRKKLT